MELPNELAELVKEARLWSKRDIWDKALLPPPVGGAYCWWFKQVPDSVPVENCLSRHGFTLLYLASTQQKPSGKNPPKPRHLRQRIRYHFRGNAAGSTLRLSLGCLLGFPLQKTGKSGKQMTFGEAEGALSEWLAEHTRVAWIELERPWLVEKHALKRLSLPLNLPGNEGHPFHSTLSQLRLKRREEAGE